MARVLILGCGCRGLALAGVLHERGHAVRGTTRDPQRTAVLQAAGVEPFLGDPDRVMTIAPAFARVAVTCVLLGSATGEPPALEALFSTRLDMLLEKMIDTTSRGIVFEVNGSVGPDRLAAGAERVRWWCRRSLIPYVLFEASHADREMPAWSAAAADAVEDVLLGRSKAPA